MTFKLAHHNKILTILNSLDDDILKKGSAYFGSGTLLALDFDKYRWSKDIDFIFPVSSSGYGYLPEKWVESPVLAGRLYIIYVNILS